MLTDATLDPVDAELAKPRAQLRSAHLHPLPRQLALMRVAERQSAYSPTWAMQLVMLFTLLGGVATGVEQRPSARQRVWVLLAGPLPGIVLASVAFAAWPHWGTHLAPVAMDWAQQLSSSACR